MLITDIVCYGRHNRLAGASHGDFNPHYHKRSNVETCFHMIKSKFGEKVRAKSDTAMVNEVLVRVLCHDVCVLIRLMYALGITPVFDDGTFASETRDDAKVGAG